MSTTARKSREVSIKQVHHLLGVLPMWMVQGEDRGDEQGSSEGAVSAKAVSKTDAAPAQAKPRGSRGAAGAEVEQASVDIGSLIQGSLKGLKDPQKGAVKPRKEIVYYRKASVW